jgi:7-cyano-7-deazaguanine reductase
LTGLAIWSINENKGKTWKFFEFFLIPEDYGALMTNYSNASKTQVESPEGVTLITFPARAHVPLVEWEYPEFQSLCPVSERHDQGVVTIRYKPTKKILESKSVRDYLMMWRNKKNWQEYITEEIAGLLYKACEPVWLTVEIKWSPRGGIAAKTTSKRGDPPFSP